MPMISLSLSLSLSLSFLSVFVSACMMTECDNGVSDMHSRYLCESNSRDL